MMDFPFSPAVDQLIELALTEDLCCGDLTSDTLFGSDQRCTGVILAKEPLVVAGFPVVQRVFERVSPQCEVSQEIEDGNEVGSSTILGRVQGPVQSVLRAERTALNFVRHLSGVATTVARYVRTAGEGGPRIVDTRKTTPGFRELEKYAVRMGGGHNHRFNLGSSVMIKDNHIAAVGSIAEAVRRCRERVPHTATIEVEVCNLEMVDEAIAAGADIVMLDNMSNDEMAQAVKRCNGRALTEASGGITDERLGALRQVGVDIVSSGALTHSAPAADISLDLEGT